VPLFRQGTDGFCKKAEAFDFDSQLVCFCPEQPASYPDDIADVEFFQQVMLFAEYVPFSW
jgi:hypothetical protein